MYECHAEPAEELSEEEEEVRFEGEDGTYSGEQAYLTAVHPCRVCVSVCVCVCEIFIRNIFQDTLKCKNVLLKLAIYPYYNDHTLDVS